MEKPSEHVIVSFGELRFERDVKVINARPTPWGWRDALGDYSFEIRRGGGTSLKVMAPQRLLEILGESDIKNPARRLEKLRDSGCEVQLIPNDGKPFNKSRIPESLHSFVPDPPQRGFSKFLLTVHCPSGLRNFLVANLLPGGSVQPGGNHL